MDKALNRVVHKETGRVYSKTLKDHGKSHSVGVWSLPDRILFTNCLVLDLKHALAIERERWQVGLPNNRNVLQYQYLSIIATLRIVILPSIALYRVPRPLPATLLTLPFILPFALLQ
jgi:hypothetical protein